MITLKKTFRRKQIDFTQVLKTREIVIYKLEIENSSWYEVFRYRIHKPDAYHDDYYEVYPSSEEFGNCAWSCSNKKVVEKVLKEHFPDLDPDIYLQYVG